MNELLEILQKELNIYEEILKISKNKTDIIKEDRALDLDPLVREEEEKVAQVIALEKKRISCVKRICQSLQINDDNISISELSKYVDEKQELLDFRDKITKVLRDLKRTNSLNQKLVQSSLEYVNFMVNLATGANQNVTYGASGQKNTKGQTNFFDMKL